MLEMRHLAASGTHQELSASRRSRARELKLDGYRAQLRVQDGKAQIRTRGGLDWTEQFAAIAKRAGTLPDCVIDGEICALDHEQMPSFAALQTALSENQSENLVFFAFDLLIESSEDLRFLPLSDRKQGLQALLEAADLGTSIRYVAHFESTADTILLQKMSRAFTPLVAKQRIRASRKSSCPVVTPTFSFPRAPAANQRNRNIVVRINQQSPARFLGYLRSRHSPALLIRRRLQPDIPISVNVHEPFNQRGAELSP
jgi:ATP dependent DNA ligase-like protein